jgi:hypothetical protein
LAEADLLRNFREVALTPRATTCGCPPGIPVDNGPTLQDEGEGVLDGDVDGVGVIVIVTGGCGGETAVIVSTTRGTSVLGWLSTFTTEYCISLRARVSFDLGRRGNA